MIQTTTWLYLPPLIAATGNLVFDMTSTAWKPYGTQMEHPHIVRFSCKTTHIMLIFVVNLWVNSTSPIDPMWKANNNGEKTKTPFSRGYVPVTTASFQDAKQKNDSTTDLWHSSKLTLEPEKCTLEREIPFGKHPFLGSKCQF